MKFYLLGKIVAVHGVRGEVLIAHSLKNPKLLSLCEALLIEVWKDSLIPFFIKNIEINEHDIMVMFEEINRREHAKEFLQKNVYIYKEDEVAPEMANDWNYLIGYQIFSQENNYIGIVADILNMNGMYLIETKFQDKNISLPLHEHLILSINKDMRTLQMEIADGLLYLQ